MATSKRIAKILIVEDDSSFRELMVQVLRRHGHVVDGEGDGESALQRLIEERFDLLVSDVVLPKMMGGELIERLHAIASESETAPPPPPIILMSGMYQQRDQAKFMKAHFGVKAFLRKPFTLASFMKAIERALGPRGVTREDMQQVARVALKKVRREDAIPAEAPNASDDTASLFETLSEASSSEYRPAAPEAIVEPAVSELPQERIHVVIPYRSPSDFLQEYTENIGRGGLYIRTARPAEVGARLELSLIVPTGNETHEVAVDAEVVYACRDAEGGTPPGMGVQFVNVPEETRAQLAHIAELAHEDARTGRPLLLMVHGMMDALGLLRERVPDADLRVREIGALAQVVDTARATEPPDLILIRIPTESHITATENVVRELKASPTTARVITVITGSEEARGPMLDCGADAFFVLPVEGESFLRLASYILTAAQRRRHVRARFRDKVVLRMAGVTLYVQGIDISESGMGLTFRGNIQTSQALELELSLPGGVITASAEVKWVTSLESGCRFGVTFVGLSDAQRALIGEYVREAVRMSSYIRWVSAKERAG